MCVSPSCERNLKYDLSVLIAKLFFKKQIHFQFYKLLAFSLKGSNPTPSQSLIMASTQVQSSLLFSTSQTRDHRKMLKPVPHDFGSQRLIPASQDPTQQSQGQICHEGLGCVYAMSCLRRILLNY